MVRYRGGRAAIDASVYPDLEPFGELGCTYLQLDDTSLAYLNDPRQREYIASKGGDPDRQHV